jgi:hypothetical protein
MSVKIMTLVWDHYWRGGGHRLTALALADHADHSGENVRPGVRLLMDKTMQSERTVRSQLADFRAEGLIIPLRYAQGGRKRVAAGGDLKGYATVYRFNPLWISNPAEFAPFRRPDERVQPSEEKGATDCGKGCKAFADQPSRTVTEPTTTVPATDRTVVVVVGLEEPALQAYRSSILKSLESCPPGLHQQIVDEALGAASTGSIRKNAGSYVRGLAANARRGTFVPVAGIAVAAARRRRDEEHAQRVAEEAERKARETPEARESARRARDAALAKLGRPAPRPSSVVAGTAASNDR